MYLKKKQIAAAFNRQAHKYPQEVKIQAQVAQKCLEVVPPGNYPLVLEIGAGGGILTCLIPQKIKYSQLVVLDLAKEMLKLCPLGIKILADGEHLPFKRASFDLVLSASTFQWYEEGPRALLNTLGLLKKGGFFSFAFFVQGTLKEIAKASQESGFGSVYPLPASKPFLDFLTQAKIKFSAQEEESKIYFPGVKDILYHLKNTGTSYTPDKKAVSPSRLKKFFHFYAKHFQADKGFFLTYKTLYLWGKI
ncbi:MAG: Methyltransferase type 11 [Desulfonauticus sp. 38_4375]|jgi:malonyl-CoA O-methyltransferase|nr:MAG: Methyltransferase type 11 [Desulfonauticus sp. 38_4375]